MLCLKCVCDFFESIFEKCHCLGELCNDSRLYNNVYKVLTFENISWKSVSVFEICFEMLWASNYEHSTYSKSLIYFPPPLDISTLPLIDKKPYHWMWRDMHRLLYSHRRQLVGRFSNCRKGLRSFYRRQHRRIIEGLRYFYRGSLITRNCIAF